MNDALETTQQEDNNAIEPTAETQQEDTTAVDNNTDAQDTSDTTPTDLPAADTAEEQQTPEWFMKDKYKSIDEQAKAAFELQKKMGKYWGAPQDNYNIEGLEGIEKDDPLVENLAPVLKEVGLSQDGFSELVKAYQAANHSMMKKYEEELKEHLTTKDVANYKAVNQWMNETLTPEEIQQIQNNWLMTPADFKLLNQFRLMSAPSSNVPSPSNNNMPKFESSKEVENDKIKYRKEVKDGMRSPDKNYENQLAQRFMDARSREMRGNR